MENRLISVSVESFGQIDHGNSGEIKNGMNLQIGE